MHTESLYLYLFKEEHLEVNWEHASQGFSSQPYKSQIQVTFSPPKHSYQCKMYTAVWIFFKVSFATTKIDLVQRIVVYINPRQLPTCISINYCVYIMDKL